MKIKLLQWNIWYKEDIKNIASELKRFDADIVCVQELWFPIGDKKPLTILSDIYPHIHYEIADTFEGLGSQCNAILSKYPLVDAFSGFVQNPSVDKNDYSKEGRIYVENKVLIKDKKISIGTVHLSYTDRFIGNEIKDLEVGNLINFVKRNEKNYIFMGDLNFSKDSKYLKELENNLKYYDTLNTWTTKPFSYHGFEEEKLNWKLDYVFSSKDINLSNIEVLNTKYSDHLPIYCEYILEDTNE